MTYRLRRAHTPDDVQAVAGLWSEASRWLWLLGQDQWQYPPRTGRICLSVASGTCWLVEQDGAAVGTVTVDDRADPEFWTATDEPASALYVHRLIVARTVAGVGLGSALLDFAGGLAGQAGRVWVRADAWKTNVALHAWYLRQEFAMVRVVDLPHRGSGALFQRHAAVRVGGGPVLPHP